MKELGDQWIEEIDGKKHMVKAVTPYRDNKCDGCSFLCSVGLKTIECKVESIIGCKMDINQRPCPVFARNLIIKDLGLVNELGCLPNPWNDKKYPTIYSIGDGVNFEIEWFVESDNGTTHAKAYGKTRQEAIDAWNQRGEVV